jgi:hypothetical protein
MPMGFVILHLLNNTRAETEPDMRELQASSQTAGKE